MLKKTERLMIVLHKIYIDKDHDDDDVDDGVAYCCRVYMVEPFLYKLLEPLKKGFCMLYVFLVFFFHSVCVLVFKYFVAILHVLRMLQMLASVDVLHFLFAHSKMFY